MDGIILFNTFYLLLRLRAAMCIVEVSIIRPPYALHSNDKIKIVWCAVLCNVYAASNGPLTCDTFAVHCSQFSVQVE